MPSVLAFFHIGCSGGHTFSYALRDALKNYPGEILHGGKSAAELAAHYAVLPPAKKNAPTIFSGHNVYGLHRLIDAPVRYFTLMRDPLKKLRCDFQYQHEQYLKGFEESRFAIHFDSFLDHLEALAAMHSIGAALVCARSSCGWLYDEAMDDPVRAAFDAAPDDAARVERMEAQLSSTMAFSGITELMTGSLILFGSRFLDRIPAGWRRWRLNKSESQKVQLTESQMRRAEAILAVDIALYRRRRQAFCGELQALLTDYGDLREFYLENKAADIMKDEYSRAGFLEGRLAESGILPEISIDGQEIGSLLRQYVAA
jgi:hypothetical protein